KELASSGIWNSFSQLSSILMTGMDLLIANIMLGASPAGVLAVAKTAPMALLMLINVVPQAFAPQLTITYAKETRVVFRKELISTLRVTALLTAIPIAGFIALSSEFFKLWVPTMANGELSILGIWTMVSMVASFGVLPLVYLFTITNKLKLPSLVVFCMGIANIIIVLFLLRYTSLGLYAIAGVSSILEGFRYLIFIPIYAAKCLDEPRSTFYPSIFRSLTYMGMLLIGFKGIAILIPATHWAILLLDAGLMAAFGVVLGYFFMFDPDTRVKVNGFIHRKLFRRK
ncbi:MAG: hypothetical protein WBL80_05415, partial [Erysipelotrichaceae bacterium]